MTLARRLATDGFAIVGRALGPAMLRRLLGSLAAPADDRPGRRNLLHENAVVREIAVAPALAGLASKLGGGRMFPVRAILFDKSPAANWAVPFHQDVAIAVRERREAPGFGGWSVKAGVVHCQPPDDVLAGLLAVRLQLDDCGPENGPLEVLPGTHRAGRLDEPAIERLRAAARPYPCLVPVGGALAMRPLLLHASARARWPGHRRVLHVEYASRPLPHGLQWHADGGAGRITPWAPRGRRAVALAGV